MRKFRLAIHAAVAFSACLALGHQAQAASPLVYLASNGANSGACTRTAPCLTFAYALTQVSPKGEIVVLDTSSHASFSITKSVTIEAAPGASVIISSPAASSTAVSITVAASDSVALRGLTVLGHGTGANGIKSNGTGAVHVENCVVSGFTSHGIWQAASGKMFVKDTAVRDGQGYGIRMYVNSGRIVGSVDHCRVENIVSGSSASYPGKGVLFGNNTEVSVSNTVSAGNFSNGFEAGGSARVTISDSTAEGNEANGFFVTGGAHMALTHCRGASNFSNGAAVDAGDITIDSSAFSQNHGAGVQTQASAAIIVVGNSLVFNNVNGLLNSAGFLISRGNNTVTGNTNYDSFDVTYNTNPQ